MSGKRRQAARGGATAESCGGSRGVGALGHCGADATLAAGTGPCGLRYRRLDWVAGIGLGAVTVAVSPVAGLLGPVAIAVCAAVLSLPVWAVWGWLVRRG